MSREVWSKQQITDLIDGSAKAYVKINHGNVKIYDGTGRAEIDLEDHCSGYEDYQDKRRWITTCNPSKIK